jgi:hypothetical protein
MGGPLVQIMILPWNVATSTHKNMESMMTDIMNFERQFM